MGWRDGIPLEVAELDRPTSGWRSGIPVRAAVPQDQPADLSQPRTASGVLDSFQAGWQGSATGLALRGKLPDIVLDAHNAKWYEKALSSLGQMGAELPLMVAGAAVGTVGGAATGAAVSGPAAPAGAAVGGILGGGAGAFAVPAAIRQSLIEAYKSGTVDSSGGFLNSVRIVLKTTAKEGAVGALTMGAGGVAARVAGKALAPAIGESISVAGGMRAIGAAGTAAEVGTMVVTPAALDGHLPEWSDFVNAAVVVGFAKGAVALGAPAVRATAGKLGDIYAKTGIRPEQVVADAQRDPTIAAELMRAATDPKTVALESAMREIDALAAKHKDEPLINQYFKDGDIDRGTARIVDKYGKELSKETLDTLMPRMARDAETGESIMAADSVRGTHIFDLREEIAQRHIAAAEGIPRAYQQAAAAETVANAMPQAHKIADFIGNMDGKIPDAKTPGHVNYKFVEGPEDLHAIMAAGSRAFAEEIAAKRGPPKSYDETLQSAREKLAAGLGVKVGDIPLDEFVLMKYAMVRDATVEAKEAAKVIADKRAAGIEITEADVRAQNAAAAMVEATLSNALGKSTEVARALAIHKAMKQVTALAKDVKAAREKYGDDPALMAKLLLEMDTPEKMAKFLNTATIWEKVVEGWKAGILSGPVTHMANVIGNTTFMALRPIVDLTAAAIGKVTGANERVLAAEPFARVFGNIQGAKEALQLAGSAMRLAYEEGGLKGLVKEMAVGTETGPQKAETFRKAIEGTKGDVIRLPFRALQLADTFFKTVNERGEAYALATRQAVSEGFNIRTREFRERVVDLVQNDISINAAASEAGLRFTFNMPLGEKGQAVSKLVREMHLELFVPFIRTPGNILKELVRMSPGAPLVGEWRAAIQEGGARQAQAIAEVGMGTAIMGVVASYALDGSVSGQGSPDPGKKRVSAAAGWQPYSIKIGDTWYSYQRLQPVGTLIGIAADMAEMWDVMSADEADKLPKMVSVAFANAVTNQTFLQGITNIVNAMSDPKRFFPRLAQSMAASLVPNIIGQPTAMADPYVREINSMLDAVRSRIPGQREQLPATRDVWGTEVGTKSRLGGISPVTETTESTDLVRTEADRIGFSVGGAPKTVHLGRGTGKLGDVEISPEQRNKFTEISGKTAHDILAPIVTGPNWERLPDLIQKRIYAKAFTLAHKQAAVQVFTGEERTALIGQITQKVQEELRP